jgi:chromosomal replication initiation ATPase DnaA
MVDKKQGEMSKFTSCVTTGENCESSAVVVSKKHPIKILELIGEEFGVSVPVLLSKDRHHSIMVARKAAYWIFRRLGYSFPEIGRIMYKNHCTIFCVLKKAEGLRRDDKEFLRQTDYLLGKIK